MPTVAFGAHHRPILSYGLGASDKEVYDMSISCIPHQEIPLTARRYTDRALPKNILLGVAIAALIWASLAAGTRMTLSWSPVGGATVTRSVAMSSTAAAVLNFAR